ncbi:MAG: T9SS type A sorting domain-containing protein [Bacteroidales bacterium]|nr:T9SS type A sorting domain-containing protein [Bacteroidales bacterium]
MKTLPRYTIKDLIRKSSVLTMILLLTCWIAGYSQMTLTNGTYVRINAASLLNSSENVVVNAGATLDVQGTLILKKNLVNQNAAANSLGSGAVEFWGSVNQAISGQNIIQNMKVANAAGLSVAGNTSVNGILTLTSGLVTLGTSNFLLGPTSSVAGGPAVTNMVVPTSSGQLQKEFPPAGGTFTYPVGDATGVAEFSPVTLAFNSGTFAANNYAGVTLVDAQYPGTATSYLTRYWNVTHSGITNFSCNSTFQYVDADVVGAEGNIFCFRVLPGPFTAYNATNPVANQMDAHGLASFGTFTGNLGNSVVPPPVRSLQDKIIAGGPDCADATQTMLIAGNGTYYVVIGGGSVTHIAGTNIIYYPGTRVLSGGYMHGYISGVFCTPFIHPGAQAPVVAGIENPGIGNPNNSFFKIYPNPTPGKFTLELTGDVTASQVHVEIYGVLGERILSKDMQIDRKQEFSLSEKPTGVYVVHVTSGLNSETEKIIKR